MNQEDKELLLKDLSARLPYGVKFLRESWNYEWDQEMSVVETLEDIDNEGYINHTRVYKVEDIKPYLRPMSSMTEEEDNEWNGLNIDPLLEAVKERHTRIEDLMLRAKSQYKPLDYLIAHHFDYRGLIPKGLAIAVTEENNPYKE